MKKDIDILVIGSLNMDLVIESERNPYPGETLKGNNFFVLPGGKGNNQAVAVGRLGGNTAFIGCVGNDAYGQQLADNLVKNNVKTVGVKRLEHISTGLALINVFNGQNTIIIYEGANGQCGEPLIEEMKQLIERAHILLMQFEIPMPALEKAVEIANSTGTKVILNPAPAAKINEELLKKIDILIPNEIEAKIMLGYKADEEVNYEDLIYEFKRKGVKDVIITLGKEGAIFSYKDNISRKDAYLVKAVDSTGAGDAFIGGFCFALAKGKEIDEAVECGTKVAAIKVTKMGAQSGLPTFEELEGFSGSN